MRALLLSALCLSLLGCPVAWDSLDLVAQDEPRADWCELYCEDVADLCKSGPEAEECSEAWEDEDFAAFRCDDRHDYLLRDGDCDWQP